MITVFLVSIIVGLIFAIVTAKHDVYEDAVFNGLFGSFFGIIPGLVIAIVVGNLAPSERVVEYRVDLVAFADSSNPGGALFLGTGVIDDAHVYKYYYKKGNNRMYGYVDALQSTIIEDEDNNPYTIKYRYTAENFDNFVVKFYPRELIEFHVPKDTVSRRFRANLQ